jgi:uncharacterized coiled-coil DUF342 family protein
LSKSSFGLLDEAKEVEEKYSKSSKSIEEASKKYLELPEKLNNAFKQLETLNNQSSDLYSDLENADQELATLQQFKLSEYP